ncbi:DUF2637 domain-containing protein [Streptomyces tateyamensis]|uniref:DUF2637 domain-containing protein n=1 Tax=Streptomyces tateyamensis TaxID=565073 RepID=UPI001FE71C67|nr:DUF2637 domain-containing protein [Streptomyces tateyamensis]
MTPDQVRSAERMLSVGTWVITFGAVLYSVLTVTPLMSAHTPPGWRWTAPILPLVVDAAVVIVVRMDSTLARLGGHGGSWPVALRWMTGVMTVLLNVGLSALHRDAVGVVVHAVAPLLLIVTAEAALAYRRAITAALAAHAAAERAEHERRERLAAERQRQARADRLAEQEAAERREEKRREHEAVLAREQREHEARLARDERDAAAAREAAERAEQAQREARERAAREAREREVSERERRERDALERVRQELLSAGPATERLPEAKARAIVLAARQVGLPQRTAVELTGWSAGWVAARYQDLPKAEHPHIVLAAFPAAQELEEIAS